MRRALIPGKGLRARASGVVEVVGMVVILWSFW